MINPVNDIYIDPKKITYLNKTGGCASAYYVDIVIDGCYIKLAFDEKYIRDDVFHAIKKAMEK